MNDNKNFDENWDEDEMEDDDLFVIIARHPGEPNQAQIQISKISNIKWDRISGGVQKVSGFFSLYGYIDYELATECGIACSGQHGHYKNDAKIYIPKGANSYEPYKAGYQYLLKQAGHKPRSIISSNRPKNEKPCTKKILSLLDHNDGNGLLREFLRTELLKIGYKPFTIRAALKALKDQGKISCIGSSYSKTQMIFIKN